MQRVRRNGRPSRLLEKYAHMVADPCSAELINGLYGDDQGIPTRFQSFYTPPTSATATCGFVLWYPSYTNQGNAAAATASGNLFFFHTASPSTGIVNTGGDPLGTAAASSSRILPDPAYAFVSGAACDASRLLGACLKVTYTGPLQAASGQICALQNIPLNNLFVDGVTPASTVDDLFVLSSHSQRFGVETAEIAYNMIDPALERYRTSEDLLITRVAATPTVQDDSAKTFVPTGFGFAFRGLTAGDTDKLQIEFHKNIDWKPAYGQGIPITPATTVADTSRLEAVLKWLNSRSREWWDLSKHHAVPLARAVFQGYYARNRLM